MVPDFYYISHKKRGLLMRHRFSLSIFLLILATTGCEIFSTYQPTSTIFSTSDEQDQVYRLLRQSKRYDELNKRQREATCKRLKLDYQILSDWQTAWLLVYSLNDNFNCIHQDKTLELLKVIQAAQGTSTQLQWLNNNQIILLMDLDKHQTMNNDLSIQLNKTQLQLIQTQEQLKKANSKLQALTAIETNINKKLDNE